jgi:high affinity Mn2+ porin
MKRVLLWSLLVLSETCLAQIPVIPDSARNINTDFHFQMTTVTQRKFSMTAPYTGANSLSGEEETETTMTATIFWGVQLWKGAEFYYNPEIAGGAGISSAKGVAGFTNGEAFRVGNPAPVIYTARAFLRQTFSLGGEVEKIPESANQVTKERTSRYFSVTLGKFSIADFFDNNRFSHDPRSQFFNWGLMSNGAWDYPANTRGYTWGGVLEYGAPKWKVRFASVMVPTTANGNEMDTNFGEANSNVLEFEKPYSIGSRKGIIRALGFVTNAYMGNYDLSVQQNPTAPDITTTRAYGRNKYGWGVNVEQEIGDYAGLFARASWNDGQNETWAFTEIDQSISAGILLDGPLWKRKKDAIGFAAVANGISTPHANYLGSGGYGFIIGDGKINYAREIIAEAYYKINLFYGGFWLTADYQFVANPAYNKDRGPANIVSLRAHIEL